MVNPLVSIALPNLNNRRFLVDRLESILAQSYQHWELIIVDSYSDDGAWELIQEYAVKDSRFRISQAPREGIYPGLNRCLRQVEGQYVYIATSDDTMDPGCLEKMVAALEANPDCGICHVCLRVIDENGDTIDGKWRRFPVSKYFGPLMDVPHIRRAPHDGILHCGVYTVYTSLTQFLTRRSVFDEAGLFRSDYGSEGDFEWAMRATLVHSTVHLPEELATWRMYQEQATARLTLETSSRHKGFCKMVKAAVMTLPERDRALFNKIRLRRLLFPYRRLQVEYGVWERPGKIRKLLYLLRMLCISPYAVFDFISSTFIRHGTVDDDFKFIRQEMERLGLGKHIKLCPATQAGGETLKNSDA